MKSKLHRFKVEISGESTVAVIKAATTKAARAYLQSTYSGAEVTAWPYGYTLTELSDLRSVDEALDGVTITATA